MKEVQVDFKIEAEGLSSAVRSAARAFRSLLIASSVAYKAGYLIENRRGRNKLVKVGRGVRS